MFAEIILKYLLLLLSTNHYEDDFSTPGIIKTKHRNSLKVHYPLQVALVSIQFRLSKLISKKQAHLNVEL